MTKITFIQTGGTIDKDYPQGEDHHGYEFKISGAASELVMDKLYRTGLVFETEFFSVCKKDSLDMTEEDRKNLKEKIKSIDNDKIIVTHGTDTIQMTAAVLDDITDKVIILTGASLPEKFTLSDADFNFGMACATAQILPAGIYIALDGHVTPWKEFEHLNIGKAHNNAHDGYEVD